MDFTPYKYELHTLLDSFGFDFCWFSCKLWVPYWYFIYILYQVYTSFANLVATLNVMPT